MKNPILIFVLSLMFSSISFAQNKKPEMTPKNSTTNIINKTKNNTFLPNINSLANAITKAIRAKIIEFCTTEQGLYSGYKNNQSAPKNKFAGILITKEFSLKIILSHNFIDSIHFVNIILSGTYDSINITGKVNLHLKKNQFANKPLTKDGLKATGSVDNNSYDMTYPKDTYIGLTETELLCEGHFFYNMTPCYFENGYIVFNDDINSGDFSEGCTLIVNSDTYTFNEGKWIKKL